MATRKIVLASSSPRRKELLEKLGLKFEVEPSHCEEKIVPGLKPRDLAIALSLQKAGAVAVNHKNALIIAADTFGVLDGKVLGKPHTESEARKMLKIISGKAHQVITGFTIIDTRSHKIVSKSVETTVYIKKLTMEEIEAYVKSKEPLDKAGGYAIQGLGSIIVERIEGDFFNVIGLPLYALVESLKDFGIKIL